jgi:hypothetical protein
MSTALAVQHDDGHALTGGLKFATPLADLAEFGELPEKRRNEVRVLLPLLERVHAQLGERSLQAACTIVAASSRHLMRGLSHQTLRRKYEAFRDSAGDEHPVGNWRVLVKGYKGPNKQPREFQLEVKRVSQLNHCSVGEAMQQLRERWEAGESIAGYGTWLEHYQRTYPMRPLPKVWPRGFYPLGWSVRNLRRYGSSKGARKLFQRGIAAAKQHFPSITRDPSQLRPLELIVIDDFELDVMCAFPGDEHHKPQIDRVAGLLAMDVATRRKLHWGLGLRITREVRQADDTVKTVRTGISRVDVQLLIHGLFEKFGLPDYPVTILCENAAASISPELELSLTTLFQGRVRVERTGLIEHRNLANGFTERGGKPWEKGWIEAAFAKLWNILGAQKGYKGNNMRLNAPGDLDAKLRYTKLLLGQGERALNLPPEKIALLRLPFQTPDELREAFAWACALSDQRTNHRYIGFDRVTEFLLEEGGEPQPFTALALLSPDAQAKVQPVERMESSVERWQRLISTVTLTPIDRSVLAVFLLTPKRAAYRNNAITFRHRDVGYSYVDPTGDVFRDVAEGTDFLCYLNPAAPDELHITQLNGAKTGTLTRLGGKRGMVDIRDKAALKTAAAIQAAILNRVVAENRALHADQATLEEAEREHNAAIAISHASTTSTLTTAQKIGLAAGESAARAHEQLQQAKRDARGVPAQGGMRLDDITAPADEAPQLANADAVPPRPEEEISLDDL